MKTDDQKLKQRITVRVNENLKKNWPWSREFCLWISLWLTTWLVVVIGLYGIIKNITITCKKSDKRMHCRLINIFTTIKKYQPDEAWICKKDNCFAVNVNKIPCYKCHSYLYISILKFESRKRSHPFFFYSDKTRLGQ